MNKKRNTGNEIRYATVDGDGRIVTHAKHTPLDNATVDKLIAKIKDYIIDYTDETSV